MATDPVQMEQTPAKCRLRVNGEIHLCAGLSGG